MAIQTTTFKGARYIVKFHDPIEWADTESYEAIEAVQHEASTYISKQPVPAGVQIDNEEFWLLWADPNAQMEELRQLVAGYVEDVQALDTLVDAINHALPIADFDSNNTVSKAITFDVSKARVFETVTDMQASNTLTSGMVCHTNGFYASGDGGAAWYEIADTGTANGMNVIACKELFAKLVIDGDTVNLMQVGAKNDGSTDCANIFNAMTENYNIYLPSGIYLVNSTITPKHAIYSDTFERVKAGNYETLTGIIKSGISGNNPVINVSNVVTLHDFAICCNSANNGINVTTRTCLYNLFIYDLEGIGINVIPVSGTSRIIYADNITIEGAAGFPESTGVYCNKYSFDSKFENLEIMRIHKGITLCTQVLFSNVHLWGGSFGQSVAPSENWKDSSCGIELISDENDIARFIGDNVYIDTFRIFIRTYDETATAEITNIVALSDNSINWGSRIIPLVYTEGTRSRIKIVGGIIRYNDYFNIIKLYTEPAYVSITDVSFIDWNDVNEDSTKRHYMRYPSCHSFEHYFKRSDINDKHLPFAVIHTPNDSTFDLFFGTYGQFAKLRVTTTGRNVTITTLDHNSVISPDYHYYYDGVYLFIYGYVTTGTVDWPVTAQIENNTNAFLLDASSMIGKLYRFFYEPIDELPDTAVSFNIQ